MATGTEFVVYCNIRAALSQPYREFIDFSGLVFCG